MFRAIGIIIAWLPTIVATVMSIEQLVSGDTKGEDKKAIALGALYRVLTQAGVQLPQSVKVVISTAVDVVVAVLNMLGIGGFRDSDEQETSEILPSAHIREVEEVEVKLATASIAEKVDTISANDERLDELEELLTQE